ncbi:MAG: type II toxin-antitoxin system MqsA family antitoxin [Planctomycetota bacterium]|nr:type II toxin-antitoxin system MqsA family antitoxin [Planctomycetota bacterium]
MTKKNFAHLQRSIREMGSILRGEMAPAREFRLSRGRLVEVKPEARPHVPVVRAADVKRIRKRLKLSQGDFAAVFRIPVKTLQKWEQGNRKPEGPACVLLRVIERHPEAVLESLHAAKGA